MNKIKFLTPFLLVTLLVSSCGEKELTKKEFINILTENAAKTLPNYKSGVGKAALTNYKYVCSDKEHEEIYKDIYELTIYSLLKMYNFKIEDNYDFKNGYESTIELSKEQIKKMIDERPSSLDYDTFLKEDDHRFIQNGNNLTYTTFRSDKTGNFEVSTTLNEYNLMVDRKSKVHYIVEEQDANIELEYFLTFQFSFNK